MSDLKPNQFVSELLPYTGAKRWLVGFSGGMDSTVLLHLLKQAVNELNPKPELLAIHVNHGLSEHATSWQHHCESMCAQWGIQCAAQSVAVDGQGKGLEAAARSARYAVFKSIIQAEDVLFLAHHQDDQAETVLYRLLRGAGSAGLSAIAMRRQLGLGDLARPLLQYQRDHLLTYASSQGLKWVEDESNNESHFDRNFIRNDVLPLLEQRWPTASSTLAQTAEVMADEAAVLQQVGIEDLARCEESSARLGYKAHLQSFIALPLPRQRNMIRAWCQKRGFSLPERRHLALLSPESLEQDRFSIVWRGAEIRRFGTHLYLLPTLASDTESNPALEAFEPKLVNEKNEPILLPRGGQVRLTEAAYPCLSQFGELKIALRQGGERCHPSTRQHSQTVKKLLQEFELEPWLRDVVPLLLVGSGDAEQIAAVGDLWVCKGFTQEGHDWDSVLEWQLPQI